MFKILEEENADHLAVAFDLSAPTFRHKMYDVHTKAPETDAGRTAEQVPLMKEALQTMNIPILTMEGYEADDILELWQKMSGGRNRSISVFPATGILQLVIPTLRSVSPRPAKAAHRSMIIIRKM